MHSCHLDLACKLQEYSVYVAAMIDGDSRMCLSLVDILTFNININIVVCEHGTSVTSKHFE